MRRFIEITYSYKDAAEKITNVSVFDLSNLKGHMYTEDSLILLFDWAVPEENAVIKIFLEHGKFGDYEKLCFRDFARSLTKSINGKGCTEMFEQDAPEPRGLRFDNNALLVERVRIF